MDGSLQEIIKKSHLKCQSNKKDYQSFCLLGHLVILFTQGCFILYNLWLECLRMLLDLCIAQKTGIKFSLSIRQKQNENKITVMLLRNKV